MGRAVGLGLGIAALGASACGTLLGLDDFVDGAGDAGAGAAGGTTSSTSGSGAAGGGGSGTGAAGGGGGQSCTPNEVVECPYDGPNGVGTCVAGTKTCNSQGTAFSACSGEVKPLPQDDCETPLDENCDGSTNEGCPCTPGSSEACYSGPANTLNVGICVAGTHTCNANGMGYGPCNGEQPPLAEDCGTSLDEDCNGIVVDPGAGCVCAPGSTSACYEGPQGTQNVGKCQDGTHVCLASGKAFGACTGQTLPAPEICTAVGDEDCDGSACSETLWAKAFGNLNDQFPAAVASDAAGNVIVVGKFNGSIDFGGGALPDPGGGNAFVAKLDKNGSHLWSKSLGDANEQAATGVAVDAAGNVVVVGSFTGTINFGPSSITDSGGGDGFLVKYDDAGNYVWSVRYGTAGSSDQFHSVAVDDNADVVSVVRTSTGLAVVKHSAVGAQLWEKTVSGAFGAGALAVAVDAANSIAVAGDIQGTATFGATTLTASGLDAMLVKLDAAGNFSWAKNFGDSAPQLATSVAVDAASNIVITGRHLGAINFGAGNLTSPGGGENTFVAKFDPSGLPDWSQTFGDASLELQRALDIATDAAGDIFLTGQFGGTMAFGALSLTTPGAFLVKLSPAGTAIWARSFAGATGVSLAPAPGQAGRVALAASGIGPIDFGTGAIVAGGSVDVFVASVQP